jgi:hypothetical protein
MYIVENKRNQEIAMQRLAQTKTRLEIVLQRGEKKNTEEL